MLDSHVKIVTYPLAVPQREKMTPLARGFSPGLRAILVVSFLTLLLAGCFPDHLQSTFDAKGPIAEKQLTLFYWIFWAMAFVFVTVLGGLLYITIRFRRRPGRQDIPKQVHGNTRLEVAWSIAPALVLAVVAVPTITTIFDLDRPPAGALEIKVTGHQWWWEYEYPEQGIITANEMHIPVGRAVSLTLTSVDVIHSFWAPKLGGKQDVVPTRNNPMWLLADEAGTYYGQCAEFCGISHANMRLRVVAESEGEFNAWVQLQQTDATAPAELTGLVAEGANIFENVPFRAFYANGDVVEGQQCSFCHTVEGLAISGARTGPDLTHLGGRTTIAAGLQDNTPANLKEWLQNPQEVKPGVLMPNPELTPQQIEALVAYLGSLE